jgi:hypothetical protein
MPPPQQDYPRKCRRAARTILRPTPSRRTLEFPAHSCAVREGGREGGREEGREGVSEGEKGWGAGGKGSDEGGGARVSSAMPDCKNLEHTFNRKP